MILHNSEYIVTSFKKVKLSESDVCFKKLLLLFQFEFGDRIELYQINACLMLTF